MFDIEKLEWCGYLVVTNFENTFTCFDRIHERDGVPEQTDRRTDGQRAHDGIARTYASRGKNCKRKVLYNNSCM